MTPDTKNSKKCKVRRNPSKNIFLMEEENRITMLLPNPSWQVSGLWQDMKCSDGVGWEVKECIRKGLKKVL